MLSVVIPAYNAAATIGACLDALAAQTFDGPFEIIVVDDGSSDATASIAHAHGVQVIRTERQRPAAARNAGFRAARGTIVCCTDADCEPAPDWLTQITAPFTDQAIVATKGTYLTHQTEIVARFVQLEYEDKYDRLLPQQSIDFIDTYSAAYRREKILEAGGFEESFDYLEDQELSFRLAAAGDQMVFQPEAIVYHQHADTLAAYMRKKFLIGYWKVQVVRRFPAQGVSDSHTPQVMKLQMGLVGLFLMALAAAVAGALFDLSTVDSVAGWGAAALGGAFLLTTLPFVRKAWPKDPVVALLSPLLLFARALALGVGTAWGIVSPPTTRRPSNQ